MHCMSNVIVWDIETVPDLQGFAAANGHAGKSDEEVRAELGDKFPSTSTSAPLDRAPATMSLSGN
jgi:hypothetical protein